jgi:CoA:oxalate CoA-transferase
VGEWTITKTVDEIVKQLQEGVIVCSPVPSFDQVCNDPHLLSREMIIEVEQPISGKVKTPGSLLKLSKTPGNVKFPAPMLGEHNSDVLSGMPGYTEEELDQFSSDGVI